MSKNSIEIVHHTTRLYAHRLATKMALGSLGVFLLIFITLSVLVVLSFSDDWFFTITSTLLSGYIALSSMLYLTFFILYTKEVGYSKGSYTFSFDKNGYSEKTRTMSVAIQRDGIKKIAFDKRFVLVYLSLGRRYCVPRSEKLVNYLKNNYADKLYGKQKK